MEKFRVTRDTALLAQPDPNAPPLALVTRGTELGGRIVNFMSAKHRRDSMARLPRQPTDRCRPGPSKGDIDAFSSGAIARNAAPIATRLRRLCLTEPRLSAGGPDFGRSGYNQ